MHTCSNCGTEFDTKYLQCPNCGCTRGDITNAASHDKRTETIGGIIAIVFIIVLIGLISYAVVLLLHPFEEGPTVFGVTDDETTTTTIESTTTVSTTTRSTTTQIPGEQTMIGSHSMIVPTGYTVSPAGNIYNFINNYEFNMVNITNANDINDVYSIGIVDKTSFKLNKETKETINQQLTQNGYSEIYSDIFGGRASYYASAQVGEGRYRILMYYNKGSNLVLAVFYANTSKLKNENVKFVYDIIATIK